RRQRATRCALVARRTRRTNCHRQAHHLEVVIVRKGGSRPKALEPLEGLQQDQQSSSGNRFARTVRKRFQTIADRFAGSQAQSLNVPVDFPLLQRIALPVTPWNPRKRPSRNIRWYSFKTFSTNCGGACPRESEVRCR